MFNKKQGDHDECFKNITLTGFIVQKNIVKIQILARQACNIGFLCTHTANIQLCSNYM